MSFRKMGLAALFLAGSMSPMLTASSSYAAAKDVTVLKSYVGEWRGRGVFKRQSGDETVVCKIDITDTAQTKVTLDGRCSIAGVPPLSLKGTLGFIEKNNRFEAVVTTNAAYKGIAVGKRRGDNVKFDFQDADKNKERNLKFEIDLALKNGDIVVDFKVIDVDTGRFSTANIPFKK